MRYFIKLSYNGTKYAGWQRQPNAMTVQEILETNFSKVLREKIQLTGCGRTDTGVHARGYFAHFDSENLGGMLLIDRINRMLPDDISISDIYPVAEEAHARFDAIQRRYRYKVSLQKNPFESEFSWQYPFSEVPDLKKLNEAASILLDYKDFSPFCKTNTDALTRTCDLRESFWTYNPADQTLVYQVTSDRFLRGMIRLIVGMCIRVSAGKTDLEEVRLALENQTILHGSWLVPPQGLTLLDVRYPYPLIPLDQAATLTN